MLVTSAKKSVFASLALLGVLQGTAEALYQSDIGKNEWHLETLGELSDSILFPDHKAYTLSTDGLLTHFDTTTQTINWKKQLPQGGFEEYRMRHMGKNLLIHSDERVAQFNSMGQIVYEQPLEGTGRGIVEVFTHDSTVWHTFVRGDNVTVHNTKADKTFSFKLEDAESELPADFVGGFEPLQLIFSESGKLLLTAKVGTNADSNLSMVAVFDIDFSGLKSEFVSRATVKNFVGTSRTKSQVVFHVDAAHSQSFAFDPLKDKEPAKKLYSNVMETSINDDFLFTEEAQFVEYHDLAKGTSDRTVIKDLGSTSEGCKVSRPRENELFQSEGATRDISEVKLAVHCKDSFHVQTATGELAMKTSDLDQASFGSLSRGFVATDSQDLMLMFEDLSLHYYQKSQRVWQREEALSQIIQVEIFDPSKMSQNTEFADAGEEQMKQMLEPVSLIQIIPRIIQRRLDNFQVALGTFNSFFATDADTTGDINSVVPVDQFGFDKTLVLMTKPNKVIAVSSLKGQMLWSRTIKDPVRRMVLDSAGGNAEIDVITSKGQLIKLDPFTGAVKKTETLPAMPQSIDDTEFVIAQGIESGDETAHRSAIVAIPKYGEGEIVNLSSDVALATSAPSYYTQIKKEDGKMFGYRLNANTMSAENTWRISLDANQEIIDVRTQYQSISSATKHEHVLPTVFGFDGELFYKYLDQNMFSVVTRNKDEPTTLTVYIINAVTGRINHQFKEQNVSDSPQHKICQFFSEQFYVLTFSRLNPVTGISQQEMVTMELFSKKKEDDTMQLLKDYFKGAERITSDTYSSFAEEDEPVVLQEGWILPYGVKSLTLSETAGHITSRMMVLVTTENKVYMMPHNQWTPRRLHRNQIKEQAGWFPNPEDMQLEEVEVPMDVQIKSKMFLPYDPVLPQLDQKFLSYNLPIVNLEHMHTFPTRLESTSQIFAYGHDLFLVRIRPDNRFDMIDEEFNYSLLFLVIGGLIVGNYFIQGYIKAQRVRGEFLIH